MSHGVDCRLLPKHARGYSSVRRINAGQIVQCKVIFRVRISCLAICTAIIVGLAGIRRGMIDRHFCELSVQHLMSIGVKNWSKCKIIRM